MMEEDKKTVLVPTRRQQLEVISKMPDCFISQFFKISANYLTYLYNVRENRSIAGRGKFINDNEVSLMMLHNMIALSSNGRPIEKLIAIDKNKSDIILSNVFLKYLAFINAELNLEENITPLSESDNDSLEYLDTEYQPFETNKVEFNRTIVENKPQPVDDSKLESYDIDKAAEELVSAMNNKKTSKRKTNPLKVGKRKTKTKEGTE